MASSVTSCCLVHVARAALHALGLLPGLGPGRAVPLSMEPDGCPARRSVMGRECSSPHVARALSQSQYTAPRLAAPAAGRGCVGHALAYPVHGSCQEAGAAALGPSALTVA